MLLIIWMHLNLIVPCKAIHEGHSFEATLLSIMTSVTGNVNSSLGQAALSSRNSMQTLLFPFFKHRDNIKNPVWVLLLSNEATFDEFMNFCFNCFHDVMLKPTLLLLNRFCIRFDIKIMHNHLRIEVRHVFISPSKDANILPYERYEV